MSAAGLRRRLGRLEAAVAARGSRGHVQRPDIHAELTKDDPERIYGFMVSMRDSGFLPEFDQPDCAAQHRDTEGCSTCGEWHAAALRAAEQCARADCQGSGFSAAYRFSVDAFDWALSSTTEEMLAIGEDNIRINDAAGTASWSIHDRRRRR